jgi:cytochrome b561
MLWRFVTPAPMRPASMSLTAGRLASGLHVVFYVLLVALPLSGWLAASAEGGSVSLFGLATLPAAAGAGGEKFFEEAHEVLGDLMLILVIVHALAALKHHFLDKDDVLLRMLPASRRSLRLP